MFSSKNPDDSLEACACSPDIPCYPVHQHMFVMSLNDVMIICFLFWWEKHCTCAGEPCWFACTPISIPTNCFLQLHMNHLITSISQIWACDTYMAITCHIDVTFGCIVVYLHGLISHLHTYVELGSCDLYMQCDGHIVQWFIQMFVNKCTGLMIT